jgi:diguanylate cyclase (GGDEF)-like protein/putative nucleotidyltransferase with HDIG domain
MTDTRTNAVRVERVWERAGLPLRGMAYLLAVLAAAAAVAAQLLLRLHGGDVTPDQLAMLVLLATAAAAAQVFVVITPRNQSYHTTIVFLIPAALLLPPELLPLVAAIQHLPEWLKERYPWYIQSFNVANYSLDLLAAWATARAVMGASWLISGEQPRVAVAGVAAAVALVGTNHVLLAVMLRFARGHSLRTSGLFTFESLSTDLVLATLGVTLTFVWKTDPWLAVLALTPLLLIHRSLAVPALEAEARVDPKTGLFNPRHFAAALTEELARAKRLGHPASLLMVDLDLLREINNTYGHPAGDAVLQGIAETFREELRDCDVAARFGGEEFSILLPETAKPVALEVAERIRRAVAERTFVVDTAVDGIHATVSIGVATFPADADAAKAEDLVRTADIALYGAKKQGRNRVVAAGDEPLVLTDRRPARVVAVAVGDQHAPVPRAEWRAGAPEEAAGADTRAAAPAPERAIAASLSHRLAVLVVGVGGVGILAGGAGIAFGHGRDLVGMLTLAVLVGIGQAFALETQQGSISVSAVGVIVGAALFGPRVALVLALTTSVVEWSLRRTELHRLVFNVGTVTLASEAAAGIFAVLGSRGIQTAVAGVVAGLAYFVVNTGLLSLAIALDRNATSRTVWRERFSWLLPHYLGYGLIASVVTGGYHLGGAYAFAVFAVPLFLIRQTQEAYVAHTRRSVDKLREAAETIQRQNTSLEHANRLLRERSTAAMESLARAVDARDSYTAGHSRRVRQLALAVGRRLDLSSGELEVLGYAALFHDIGKLAVPDAILLKPEPLTSDEWERMRSHADEGGRIIDRLGFLRDAVPAIRHHHERWDGGGYPDGLAGSDIPLGARIIHVADALDSMVTSRIYRAARPMDDALAEIREGAGTQFCPRCVKALDEVLAIGAVEAEDGSAVARAVELAGATGFGDVLLRC